MEGITLGPPHNGGNNHKIFTTILSPLIQRATGRSTSHYGDTGGLYMEAVTGVAIVIIKGARTLNTEGDKTVHVIF